MEYVYSLSELAMSINPLRSLIVSIVVLMGVCLFQYRKHLSFKKCILLYLIIMYMYLVLCLTLLDRHSTIRMVKLIPLWSYPVIFQGSRELFLEVIINIVMMMPLGFLLPLATRLKTNSAVALFGFLFSLSIECSQFIFMKGWFEIDDMIHNTLGIVIGYMIYKKLKR